MGFLAKNGEGWQLGRLGTRVSLSVSGPRVMLHRQGVFCGWDALDS